MKAKLFVTSQWVGVISTAWLFYFGMILVPQVLGNSPQVISPGTGQIYYFSNKGAFGFVTAEELRFLHLGFPVGALLLMACMVGLGLAKERSELGRLD